MAHTYHKGESITFMHKQHPYCHWCGVKTIRSKGNYAEGEEIPPNMATRDHVFQRVDSRELRDADKKRNGGRSTVVLACRECNHKRSIKAEKEFKEKHGYWYSQLPYGHWIKLN